MSERTRKVYSVTVYFRVELFNGNNILNTCSTTFVVLGDESPSKASIEAVFEATHRNAEILMAEVCESFVPAEVVDELRIRSHR